MKFSFIIFRKKKIQKFFG